MTLANGIARIELTMSWRENKLRISEVPARITANRVQTNIQTWDRSGKRVSAFYPGIKPSHLLAYRLKTDEYWTTL